MSEREASLSYSQMFKILTEFTGEVPLGVYRTDKAPPVENGRKHSEVVDVDNNIADGDKKKSKIFSRISSKK